MAALNDVNNDLKQAARQIVAAILADEPLGEGSIFEASVHLPRRGRVWVASFTGSSGQTWRSTGLTNKDQALLVAKKWEAESRAERTRMGHTARNPVLRVHRREQGSGVGQLTQKEVAMVLRMSERAVREVEKRAIAKLRRHPLLRHLWQQYGGGHLDERQSILTPAEVQALFSLADQPEERSVIKKVLELVRR